MQHRCANEDDRMKIISCAPLQWIGDCDLPGRRRKNEDESRWVYVCPLRLIPGRIVAFEERNNQIKSS